MFGRKTKTSHHPDGTTITTTTHTTKTTTPHYQSSSSSLMSRLRPRRDTPPTYSGYSTPASSATRTSRASRSTRTGLGRKKHTHGATTTAGTTTVPARKTSMGDKMSGAMMKLKGSMAGRPGVKAAGTRRMNGTDGRATRRYY